MKIEHIAIWVSDLESCKEFYIKYFNASSNKKYHNANTGFTSYFLYFGESARIEIMHRPDISTLRSTNNTIGFAHLAFSVGSKENVLKLTDTIRNDGFQVVGEPRTTGDGYFESIIKDPEGNLVEITI